MMNQDIRKAIIGALTISPTRSIESLKSEISKSLDVSKGEVMRVLRLVEDTGEVEMTDVGQLYSWARLTLKGSQSPAPFFVRAWQDMLGSPLVTMGLIVSMVGNIILIIGLFLKK